ncbi:GTPase Der [Campylobacterota bacterium]|nr:GTPase Der [Campylobacterota bacterium]
MKKIALVGRPNVGKSTLYNRLTRSYDAVTSDEAGTTRDVRSGVAIFEGKSAIVMDTGGLDNSDELFTSVRKQAIRAAREADIVLFLADGQRLADDEERKIFFELQKISKVVALVLNKRDNGKEDEIFYDYLGFGAEHLFEISCAHKRGLGALEEFVADRLESAEEAASAEEASEGEAIRVAIIGRPNVGKSALLNALVGFDRAIVSPIAGTTIDPVDEEISVAGQRLIFIDTAGIRKRSRIEGIERFAFERTEKMLQTADVALLVLDASEDFCELDERIAGLADKHKTAVIVVLNKLDIAPIDAQELEKLVRKRFIFLSFAPIITLSAETKKRVNKLFELIGKIYENYSQRIPTGELNKIVEAATARHKLPSDRGKIVKIFYATQFETKPPRIALIANRPAAIHFSYLRYLTNQIRAAVELEGAPLILEKKGRKSTSHETDQDSV